MKTVSFAFSMGFFFFSFCPPSSVVFLGFKGSEEATVSWSFVTFGAWLWWQYSALTLLLFSFIYTYIFVTGFSIVLNVPALFMYCFASPYQC